MTQLRVPDPAYGDGPVALRLLVAADGEAFLAGLSDPKVHRNAYGGKLEPTTEAVDGYIARVAGRLADDDAMILAAVDREDGSFLGSTMLFCFEEGARGPIAEIGFWMAPHARRRGFTEAAIALTIRWGFAELGLTRIQGLTDPANTASQAAMARAGMRLEGRVPDYDHPRVGRQDVVVYASELD